MQKPLYLWGPMACMKVELNGSLREVAGLKIESSVRVGFGNKFFRLGYSKTLHETTFKPIHRHLYLIAKSRIEAIHEPIMTIPEVCQTVSSHRQFSSMDQTRAHACLRLLETATIGIP